MGEYVLSQQTLSLILEYQVDISFVTSFTTFYTRGCSNFCIFLQAELQVPYLSGNTAAKFQRKIMTATPRQMPF